MKRVALALIILSAFSLAASAETIRGVVHNGTTNKPSAGDEVTLKKIGNGMEEVGKTKSNAKGEFSFTVPDSGRQPYLLWVAHQEVTYTKVAMPGSGTIAVQVFNASSTVKDITLQEHMMVLQTSPDGNTLKVDALFTLANQSSPPLTKNGQHTFEIYLPDNAKVVEATAQSAGNMALKTSVVPTGEKNKFFFGYPLRPGQTQFRIGYSLPYTGKLNLNPKLTIPTTSMLVVTPTSFKFVPEDGSVYSPQTNEQIKNVVLYVAKDLKPESKVGFQIEGTGELPREQAGGGNDAGEGGQPAGEPNRPGGGLGVPNTQPDPLHNGQWLFLGVLTVFLSAGAVYVYTAKPVEVVVSGKRGKKVRERSSSTLLDAMKEELFQLESDRVEGKITPEEYESSKAALDKTLQRAVKRQAMAK